MKKVFVLSLIFFLFVQADVFSQTLTNRERRSMNMRVLEVVEEYERTVALSDEEERNSFLNLFESGESSIYCDLIGTKEYEKYITVGEYVNVAAACTNNNLISLVYDVARTDEPVFDGNRWKVSLTFRKDVSYIEKNDFMFSTDDFYDGEKLTMKMNLSYDPAHDICQIVSVDGEKNSSRSFPEGKFLIMERYDIMSQGSKLFEKELVGSLDYDYQNKYAFIDDAKFAFADPDKKYLADTLFSMENYAKVKFRYKATRVRLKIFGGYSPLVYSVDRQSRKEDKIGVSSKAWEAGGELGINFINGKKFNLGLYFGARKTWSELTLKLTEPLSYTQEQIVSGGNGWHGSEVVANFRIDSATEKFTFNNSSFLEVMSIPIYLEAEHHLGKRIELTYGAGVKFYIERNPAEKMSLTYQASVSRDDNKFNILAGSDQTFLNPVSYVRELYCWDLGHFNIFNIEDKKIYWDPSAIATLGLDLKMADWIWFSLGLGGEIGFYPMLKTEGKIFQNNPIIYDEKNDLNVLSHSLISNVTVRRTTLWLNAGLKLKLYKFK